MTRGPLSVAFLLLSRTCQACVIYSAHVVCEKTKEKSPVGFEQWAAIFYGQSKGFTVV